MAPIDKERFGRFLRALRQARGLTQRELAERLYVSDKAVSKWETGGSLPGMDLLIPLAEVLGVTVTELLRCERNLETPLAENQVEEVVRGAIDLSARSQAERRRAGWRWLWVASAAAAGVWLAWLRHLGNTWEAMGTSVLLVCGLALGFGLWACLLAPETLPSYYDQNRVTQFSQGIFRMNLAGIPLNNRNWPYILRTIRLWCVLAPVLYPGLWLALQSVVYEGSRGWKTMLTLTAMLALLLPALLAGKLRH